MARILAIDYGNKRVGIAVTDPIKIIASPLDTVHSKDVISFLTTYFSKEEVEAVVVGYPTNEEGEATDATRQVQAFINLFRKKFPNMPLHLQDESFSSQMALQSMIAAGSNRKQRNKKSGNIDKVSAAIILQQYLEEN
ncbi:putative pre-16S rRNA nuclease [Marivirga lumbricoides]|uniref:Putative pre-16S rRNA nuclease n=1 Tax=Marivirga lumbricoides TaxID=1046115 RepID=A0A2T4DTK5_9BACT|nr:Holliday junction resolvase RuvX [Marivirga lumbricoides]GGC29832.1 putative pre-16S rRNA nuclease [Marivirga lumbricoides]